MWKTKSNKNQTKRILTNFFFDLLIEDLYNIMNYKFGMNY